MIDTISLEDRVRVVQVGGIDRSHAALRTTRDVLAVPDIAMGDGDQVERRRQRAAGRLALARDSRGADSRHREAAEHGGGEL